MTELLVIIGAFFVMYHSLSRLESAPVAPSLTPPSPSANKLTQLVTYADRLYAEKKWLAAEKAYLSVLKLDHKHITAYSHLGIIYSTQKNLPDAIECFQIAARLHPSATTFQNLGLAYFDNRNLIKSIAAFQKSIMFEPNAQRYIGLGRAQAKLGNLTDAIASLEESIKLEPTKRSLQILADLCDEAGRPAAARAAHQRISELDTRDPAATRRLSTDAAATKTKPKPLK